MMHEFCGQLGGVLTFAGFYWLVKEAVLGPVSPSRVTWFIWAVEAVLIYQTFAAAAPHSSALWIPLGFTVGAAGIFILSIPFGEGGWTRLDKWCLVGAGGTIAIWQTAGPAAGLLAGIATDLIGAIPTVVKTWRDPASESRSQWLLWWLGAMANLFAVSSWTLAEAIYPIYGITLTTTMVAILYRRRIKKASILCLIVWAMPCYGEGFLQLSAASSQYRLADWVHSSKAGVVTDIQYVGTRQSNELYLGIGYETRPMKNFSVIPLIYFITGKEGGQAGLGIGGAATFTQGKWNGFLNATRFLPIRGQIPGYMISDGSSITRKLGANWEAGLMCTAFVQTQTRLLYGGPLIRRNDNWGAWVIAFQNGSQTEIRIQRTFLFGR